MISQLASLMILMCQLREERQRIQAKQLEAEARAQRTDENSIEMRKMRMKETIQRGLKKNITWICRVWFSSTHFLFCILVPCLPFALPWRLRALGVRFYECNGRKGSSDCWARTRPTQAANHVKMFDCPLFPSLPHDCWVVFWRFVCQLCSMSWTSWRPKLLSFLKGRASQRRFSHSYQFLSVVIFLCNCTDLVLACTCHFVSIYLHSQDSDSFVRPGRWATPSGLFLHRLQATVESPHEEQRKERKAEVGIHTMCVVYVESTSFAWKAASKRMAAMTMLGCERDWLQKEAVAWAVDISSVPLAEYFWRFG